MRDLDTVFQQLQTSRFRRRFALGRRETQYLERRGLVPVLGHAREFVDTRLAPARPANDGRQTPWRNHPVFVAQHATGTCCRGCLERWHHIEAGRELTTDERDYVVAVIERWLHTQPFEPPRQLALF